MPQTLTYPGVYIDEIPSGVRTIAGVSTSVTAFIGAAKGGPLNEPVRVQSFADYERRFGDLDAKSLMSYAVRQFFANGGGEGFIVRIAKNATAASRELFSDNGDKVLKLTARDKGTAGNEIEVRIDHTARESTFTVTLQRKAGAGTPELFSGLSMNSGDPRYAPTVINDRSVLVTAERLPLGNLLNNKTGTSESGDLGGATDVTKLIDGTHNTINVVLDGKLPASRIVLDPAGANTDLALETALKTKLQGAFGAPAVTVSVTTTNNVRKILITSLTQGEGSSLRILPGDTNDAAGRLMLGPQFGGTETDAATFVRPAEVPLRAAVTGGQIAQATDLNTIPSARKAMTVRLDGQESTIEIDGADLAGALAVRLKDLAGRIEQKVRAARPSNPAFARFTATSDGTKLTLRSGTRGAGSTIEILPAGGDTLATDLKLTSAAGADVSKAAAVNTALENASEADLDLGQAYTDFIGNRSKREGIYALESVSTFNLMVLAGVTDPGILADAAAYCKERRAFLIVDSPTRKTPAEMEATARTPAVPKTSYAAVYYPWIRIADPLKKGALGTFPPSGTIAGVYARTDSTRGVWKAPAGTEATLVGVQEVEYALTDPENGTLNPRGVNCIRNFPVFGPVSWGARTLRGDDEMADEWKYVSVRRLALFLEESLYRGTKWAVFEGNDEPLWSQLRLNIGAFMQSLFRQGAFQGQTPRDAYFVRCGRDTTTQTDINLGVVNIIVGFAPLKPAEFVVIKFQQMAGQIPT